MEMVETHCSQCCKSLDSLELIHGYQLDALLVEVKVAQLNAVKPENNKDVSESSILTKSSEGNSLE